MGVVLKENDQWGGRPKGAQRCENVLLKKTLMGLFAMATNGCSTGVYVHNIHPIWYHFGCIRIYTDPWNLSYPASILPDSSEFQQCIQEYTGPDTPLFMQCQFPLLYVTTLPPSKLL